MRIPACWIVTITGRHRDGSYIREWVYMPERDAKPTEMQV
jgi:hypothetical protein